MKKFLLLLLAAPALAWAAPSLPIEQAVKIAQDDLKSRGLTGQVYITSITLEPDSVARSAFHWSIKWSAEVALNEEKKESGVQVSMDGQVARIVKVPPNRNPETGKFDPNGNTGLQNHRTRTDRPSILDIKH